MRRRSLALVAVAVMAGCGITDPAVAPGLFVLTEIDDRPLPQRVGSETFLADTIRLLPDDAWARITVVRLHSPGAAAEPVRRESDGFITRSGDRIVLDFECRDVIVISQCVAPDTLRPAGGDLILRRPTYANPPGPPFRFEPVPD